MVGNSTIRSPNPNKEGPLNLVLKNFPMKSKKWTKMSKLNLGSWSRKMRIKKIDFLNFIKLYLKNNRFLITYGIETQ